MRFSAVIVAAMSALAMAAPLDKRVYVTDLVVKYYTVTVTAGQAIPTQYKNVNKNNIGVRPKTKSSSAVAAVVVTTTSAAPVVAVVSTTAPAPVVSTPKVEVVVQITTSAAPVVKVTTSAAPVIATSSSAAVQPVATQSAAAAVVDEVETAAAAPAAGDYKSAVVYHHNVHRSNHSAPDVTFSDELAGYAATVAATCVWGHDTTVGGGGYGQNIAMTGTSSSTESAKDASVLVTGVISNMWYNGEVNDFPASEYGKASPDMSNFSAWGHFSQVVWKSTTEVGCATQYCKTGTDMFPSKTSGWYTVCNYKGAGNMGGAYGENILKSLGKATVSPTM